MCPEIITNKNGVPEAFVTACRLDRHVINGDISVTTLIQPPQVRILKKANNYFVDVVDKLDMVLGTAMHGILELSVIDSKEYWMLRGTAAYYRRNDNIKVADWIMKDLAIRFPQVEHDQIFVERTLTEELDGVEISGTQDIFYAKTGLLQDYKTAKVYAWLFPESRDSYEKQQNIYAWMLRKKGYVVNKIQLVYYFKNWEKAVATAGYKKDYPKCQVMTIDLKIWSDEEVETYLKERVRVHSEANAKGTAKCTAEERWSTGDTFAVKATNKKNAIRKFTTKAKALEFIDAEGFALINPYVEIRLGEDRKCEEYCAVRDVCPQYKARKEHKSKQKIEE